MAVIRAGATVFFLLLFLKIRMTKQITTIKTPMKMPKNRFNTTHRASSSSVTFVLMTRKYKQVSVKINRVSEMP